MHSPSSNLHSNVMDMSRWAMANMNRGMLDGKRILKEATYAEMWKPVKLPDAQSPAGISWFVGKHRQDMMISHSGGDTGYVTDLAMLPEKRIAVVWMANCDWINGGQITRAALDTAIGLAPLQIIMKRSVSRAMFTTYDEQGIDAAIEQYRTLKKERPDLYNFNEGQLNSLGGFLMRRERYPDAVRIFLLNVEAYPTSGRAYESLGGAYAAAGEREKAIQSYEKAVALDANLTRAPEELKKLKQ